MPVMNEKLYIFDYAIYEWPKGRRPIFLGIFSKPVDPPSEHLGIKCHFWPKKNQVFKAKKMATKISHKV